MRRLETEEEGLGRFKGLIRSYMRASGIEERSKVYHRVFMKNVRKILGKNVVPGKTITVLDKKLCVKMEVRVKNDDHVVVAMAGAMVAMMAVDRETALEEASLWLSKERGIEIEEERVLLGYLLCGVSPT